MKRFIFILAMAAAFYAMTNYAVGPVASAIEERNAKIEEALRL